MYELTFRNFMGLSKADITLGGITLVAGYNAAGKSSVARAFCCLITGDVKPLPEVTKSEIKLVVKTGQPEALIRLKGPQGMAEIVYPVPAERVTEGEVPTASKQALGLSNFADQKMDVRAQYLSDVLGIEPSRLDFENAMKEIGAEPNAITLAWADIRALGWDGALEKQKEQGKKQKTIWEKITGANYGSKVVEQWRPSAWDPTLNDHTVESLEKAIELAQGEVDNMLKLEAVSEMELAHLKETAAQLSDRQASLAAYISTLNTVEEAVAKAKEALTNHKVPTNIERGMECPECKTLLKLLGEELVKADGKKPNAKALKDSLAMVEKLTAAIKETQAQRDEAMADVTRASTLCNEAMACQKRLDALGDSPSTDVPDVQAARDRLARAEHNLRMFKQLEEANATQAKIKILVAVCGVMAPGGLRKKKMAEMLGEINARLAQLGQVAGWRHVVIAPDLSITYGPNPFWKLSDSEKFRVRVLLQAAFVQFDGSQVMCVDGSDILDSGESGRNGLLKLLKHVGLPTLLCMTISKNRDRIPDLKDAGLGRTYWLENFVAESYTQQAPAAVA